jgi:hypothetical protein
MMKDEKSKSLLGGDVTSAAPAEQVAPAEPAAA